MIKNLISIVMPTYNDAPYLEEALDDILAQTHSNFELIIVNDGSSDNTAEILETYKRKDSRISVFHKENGGTGSALNYGFKYAKGEFGTWASSDDRKEKNYLEVLVKFLKKNRDIEYVCSIFYSAYVKKIFKAYHWNPLKNDWVWAYATKHDESCTGEGRVVDDWAEVNSSSCYQGVCFLFTMRLKNKCGPYIKIPGEDYHMLMKMALNTRCGYIDLNLGIHSNPNDALSMQDRACVMEANKITRQLLNESKPWFLRKIPKNAHFYWGGSKMSFMRYMTIKSFKKYNPSWSVYLYTSTDSTTDASWRQIDDHHRSDSVDYKLEEDYYHRLIEEEAVKVIKVDFDKTPLTNNASEVHKSDYLRWTLLGTKGGLWCDMDVIFHRPLTDLRLNTPDREDYDTVLCFDQRGRGPSVPDAIPIGFMLSSKSNIIFRTLARLAGQKYNPLAYQAIGTELFSSLGFKSDSFRNNFINKIYNIEPEEVYYFDHNHLDKVYEENCSEEIKDKSIGVHWYGGHPLSQEYNNKLTRDNYRDYNNTFVAIAKMVLD